MRLKLRRSEWLIATPVLLLALLALWTNWQQQSSSWVGLGQNDLTSVEVEQALYQSPDSPRFWVRFRVTNRTDGPLSVNFAGKPGLWKAIHPYRWCVTEGDHRGIVSEMMPLALESDIEREKGVLRASIRASTATIIAPHGSADYYRASPSGGRAAVENAWSSAPLWMKSKTYLPRQPFKLHLVMGVRGTICASDGRRVQSFVRIGHDVGLPFPLKWKPIPAP